MYESTTGAQPTTSDDAVPFQVYLEGNSIPFDVTTDEDLGPMMLGEQGPPQLFDPGIEVQESTIPDQIIFTPVPGDDPSIDVDATVYGGRVRETTIDVFLFSVHMEGTPAIGIYAFDGTHQVDLAWVPEVIAPGYARSSSFVFDEGESDVFWWGPLAPEVSVVSISVDGDLHAAVRPRARFVVVDMTGTPRWAPLQFVAYDARGNVIESVQAEAKDPSS